MKQLPVLKPNDTVEIIAPASRCTQSDLLALKEVLESWNLNVVIDENLFGDDLLCANNDEVRFQLLERALKNPATKAVICARGGYGSMRLLPRLAAIVPPDNPKIFVGMSDTTALQLFLEQCWQWPTVHGAAAPSRFSAQSIASLKAVLFAETNRVEFTDLIPLNALAKMNHTIEAPVTGGNLTLVQASIGTPWQLNGQGKIILLEEVGERGYRVDRMLEHLNHAMIFKGAAAIILGDFSGGDEPDGTSLIKPVLQRFAASCPIPVMGLAGVGHGYTNFAIPLGTMSLLTLGTQSCLSCSR